MTDNAARFFPAIDRLQEAHFFLHGLEAYYHSANPFRWHLNAFLRALDEVPQQITMAVQNSVGFPKWHKTRRGQLGANPLLEQLGKERNFVVHQGMLKPLSSAVIGITEGRGMKIGIGLKFDPHSDSDDAVRQYIAAIQKHGDILDILLDDEDSLPAVERRWRLKQFPDIDVVELCADAWHLVGEYVNDVGGHLSENVEVPRLDCRHDLAKVRIRAYERDDLRNGIVQGFALD